MWLTYLVTVRGYSPGEAGPWKVYVEAPFHGVKVLFSTLCLGERVAAKRLIGGI